MKKSEEAELLWKKNFNYMFDHSGLPEVARSPIHLVWRSEDDEAWEYLESWREAMEEFVDEHKSLVISSTETGNGKTSWAMKLANRYIAEKAIGSGSKIRVKFVNIPKLFSRLGASISVKDEGLRTHLKEIREADLVVFDDLGAGSLNKQTYNVLYEIIDERNARSLSNIYTTNYSDELLFENIGKRLYSRIVAMSDWIEFTASDVRGMEPEEIE